jgi:hypothetical protein
MAFLVTGDTVRQERYIPWVSEIAKVAEARRLTRSPAICRTWREGAGVSLTELAGSIPCSPAALSRWERGLRRPRSDLAIAWAAALRELMQGAA